MTESNLGIILAVLENLPSSVKWSASSAEYYALGIGDLPDAAAIPVAKYLARVCKTWRPTAAEILDIWRQINSPVPVQTVDGIVAELYTLRDHYGPWVVPVPGHEDNFPCIATRGEPRWMDSRKRRIIATVGGWVAFCEDLSPPGDMRRHLLKVAQLVIDDNAELLESLRLERQSRTARQLLNAPALPEYAKESMLTGGNASMERG